MGFWKELKERKVFRVAIIYAVTGWVLAQVAGLVLPTFEAPDWVLKTIIFVLMLGFPVSLILAWALELTPDGVKVAEPAKGQKRLYSISGALAVGIAVWFLGYAMAPGETSNREQGDTSIAVLPFLDLSPAGDQDYFAQGIAEQLLDLLAKNTRMQVAARTSSFQFKSDPDDVTRIGKLLRVNYLLEGSVRRDGDRVRITAQLIDTRSGYHEWSETYTRNMTDIFALQDEISREIADELEAQFGLADGRSQDETRDVNPAAYDEYLLGRHLMNQRSRQSLQAAVQHLRKAAALDPDFAAAHAQAAIAISLLSVNGASYGDLLPDEAIAMAEPFVKRATELAPDSAETLAARGRLHGIKGDWPAADILFKKAAELNPSYMDVVVWTAAGERFNGNPEGGFRILQEAVQRDPLNYLVNINLLSAYLERGIEGEAKEIVERFEAIGDPRSSLMRGAYYEGTKDFAQATLHYLVAMREDDAHLSGLDTLRDLFSEYGMHRVVSSMPLPATEMSRFLATAPADREAIAAELRNADVDPLLLVDMEAILGNTEKAYRLLENLGDDAGTGPLYWMTLYQAGLAQRLGHSAEADRLLASLAGEMSDRRQANKEAGIVASGALFDVVTFDCQTGKRQACLDGIESGIEGHWINAFMMELLPAFDSVRETPEYGALQARRENRDAAVREKILPVLCNFDYPPDSWRPPAESCEGYIEAGN